MPDEKIRLNADRDFSIGRHTLGTWRFLELVVEERGGSEDILESESRTHRS